MFFSPWDQKVIRDSGTPYAKRKHNQVALRTPRTNYIDIITILRRTTGHPLTVPSASR
jgi:hypothetical protein